MNYSPALKILDSILYEKYKIRMIDSNGKINLSQLATCLGSEVPELARSDFLCKALKINIDGSENENICIKTEGSELVVSIPKTLQGRVAFAIDYIISEFDKINDDINSLSLQFHINRIGVIEEAENTLNNIHRESGLTDISKESLIGSRKDLGQTIDQLKRSIQNTINYVNNIPTDSIQRVFKVKVKSVLYKTKEGRMSMNEYIKATGIYVGICMELKQPAWGVSYLENAIDFLQSFEKNELIRIEGWNEEEDGFWIDKIKEYKQLLMKWKEKTEAYYIISL